VFLLGQFIITLKVKKRLLTHCILIKKDFKSFLDKYEQQNLKLNLKEFKSNDTNDIW
jgi:hypothetical protein